MKGCENHCEERKQEPCDEESEQRVLGLGRGLAKLSCRCYQVKPPTTDCRHGDAMVTARCSVRKKRARLCVKGLLQ